MKSSLYVVYTGPEIYFTAELNAGVQYIMAVRSRTVQNYAGTSVFCLFRDIKYIKAVQIYLPKELKSSPSHQRKEITGNGKCFVVFVLLCRWQFQLISK